MPTESLSPSIGILRQYSKKASMAAVAHFIIVFLVVFLFFVLYGENVVSWSFSSIPKHERLWLGFTFMLAFMNALVYLALATELKKLVKEAHDVEATHVRE